MDSPTNTTQNTSSVHSTVPNHSHAIISSLLSFPNSSPNSIAYSFDRELDKALASASGDVSAQDSLLDRTIQLASILLDSTKRCLRKRASAHNSISWFLPPDLTIKVFSKLDTKSLMKAAACCTMFNNCAMDRSSYAHIDLTTATRQAEYGVVWTMIHRAGKELRSLKLGCVARADGSDSTPSLLSGCFLNLLSYNHGFFGSCLRSLRLYNIRPLNFNTFIGVLSVCSNLTDLRLSGSDIPLLLILKTLTKKCRLLENLCFEAYQVPDIVDTKTGLPLIDFVTNSYSLTSLTLISYRLTDGLALNLAESYSKLKYLNLSRSPLNGRFLRDLGHSCKESSLETLVMRNCCNLKEKEVMELCNSLIKGKVKSIRHIDVSSNSGLVSHSGERIFRPELPLEKLKEERSDVTFVADFPLVRSGKGYRVCDEGAEEELREIEMMEARNDVENVDDSEDGESDDNDEDTSYGTGEDDSEDDVEF